MLIKFLKINFHLLSKLSIFNFIKISSLILLRTFNYSRFFYFFKNNNFQRISSEFRITSQSFQKFFPVHSIKRQIFPKLSQKSSKFIHQFLHNSYEKSLYFLNISLWFFKLLSNLSELLLSLYVVFTKFSYLNEPFLTKIWVMVQ